jgi:N-carbamoylputrescine amidase
MAHDGSHGRAKVALVQTRMGADVDANLAHARDQVAAAARQGAQIICLPELYRSLYFPQTEDAQNFRLAEPVPGPSTQAFAALAKEHGVVIVVPIFERRAQGVYHNSALVYDADGRLAGHYRKMHIPDDPEFYEKFYFAPGDLGFPVFDTQFGRVGVLICWDQWFPEAARLAALRGAQILFYPTAIGHHDTVDEATWREQHMAWETVQRGHAVANGLFVAAVNRCGREGKLRFWGQSFLSGPFGKVLARAPVDDEAILLADVDYDEIDRVRHGWPFLRDRRIDAYSHLTQRVIDEIARH